MKIHWAKNPLETEIELDTWQEERLLAVSVRNEELLAILAQVQGVITWDAKGPEDAIKRARLEMDEYHRISEHVEKILPCFRQSLMGTHLGDCTSTASSCLKCRAEKFLGINTIKGLTADAGGAIERAFSNSKIVTSDGHDYDLRKALEYLQTYNPEIDQSANLEKYGWYKKFLPQWKESATKAYKWLKTYQEKHFPDYDNAKEDLQKDLRMVLSL